MKNNIVFEIGTEELPALELHNATKQVEDLVCNQKCKHFDYEDIQIYSTPRRIVVCINGVPEKIEAKREERRGPKLEIAMQDGKYTKAAIGFAKGAGVEVDDLVQKDGCIYAMRDVPEQKIIDMLPDLFVGLIKNISWKKVQRWGSQTQEFARPIRWICAMFGNDVVDLEYAGVKSSNFSFGHRFLAPDKIELKKADDLIPALKQSYVVPTEQDREKTIREQVKKIEDKLKLVAELPASVMQEVVNLCEYPTCMVGQFDELFLSVPKEIIVDAMLVHQRYFPLFTKDGKLTNKFIVISNGNPKCEDTIVDGNERVVAARLYDAKFFFDEDKKQKLETYVEKLDEVVFQEQLGTMKAKANRVSKLSEFIGKNAKMKQAGIEDAKRAGYLCKADLVTSAVVEFTSVQGIMGSYYAESSGENAQVANAIRQHYMPRFAGDAAPSSMVGKCVACADKIDSLCGMFAVGLVPTGSSDPFALRRGAIGIISIMKEGLNFSLVDAINFSLDLYAKDGIKFNKSEVFESIIDFIITRTKVALKDEGIDHDSVEAVSAVKVEEPLVFIARARALDDARNKNPEIFENLATAFARANNLRDEKLGCKFDTKLLEAPEVKLTDAISKTNKEIANLLNNDDYAAALSSLASLREPIDNFFDQVMIMDKDEKLKNNRLKILNAFVEVFSNIADFSQI